MKNLLAAELLRLRSRPSYVVALLVILVPATALIWSLVAPMQPPSTSELAAAQRTYESSHQEWVTQHDAWNRACQEQGGTAEDCRTPEPMLRDNLPYRPTFFTVTWKSLTVSTVAVAFIAYGVGVSFVASDRSSGQWRTWLVYVPHRGRSLLAKLLVMVGAGLVTATVVIGGCLAALTILGRQWEADFTAADLTIGVALRGIVFCGAVSALGVGVGALLGRTTWALAIAGAYIIGSALVNTVFYGRTHFPQIDLIYQAFAWLRDGQVYTAWADDQGPTQYTISMTQGGLVWLGIVVVITIMGFIAHRRRDVT